MTPPIPRPYRHPRLAIDVLIVVVGVIATWGVIVWLAVSP
jgi:hypothetical protein